MAEARAVKPARVIALRRDDKCVACDIPLNAGVRALWDPTAKTSMCLACHGAPDQATPIPTDVTASTAGGATCEPATRDAVDVPQRPATDGQLPVDAGLAGGSAQREFERRKSQREERIRERFPVLGGLVLALSDEPQSTTAWAKGAEGERRVARALNQLRSQSVVVLHDRRIPRSRGNIDHLVIASSGIHVIDTKRYVGRVELRGSGTLLRPGPNQLFVNGRNKTNLVDAMTKQIEVVRTALSDLLEVEGVSSDAVILPSLCFVDADWAWLAKSMMLSGVHISGPKLLTKRIMQPGQLDIEQILRLGSRLAERLVPA